MITISLELHASLKHFCGGSLETREVPQNITIAELLEILSIPPEIGLTIIVDGKMVSQKEKLTGGEQVNLFPLRGGG